MVAAAEPPKPVAPVVEIVQVASFAPPEPVAVVPVAARVEPAPVEQPASYEVASIDDDEDYFAPRPPVRAHAREAEAKVVMRFTPLGGSDACGSLRNSAACRAIEPSADHSGRS